MNTKFIAHRGLSGIERENTLPSFVAAANREFYGIECDVHITKDGGFVIYHDDNTARLCDRDVVLTKATLQEVRALKIKEPCGEAFADSLIVPTLSEYLSVCKRYNKIAIVELKEPMNENDVVAAVKVCETEFDLSQVVFISFFFENLLFVRKHFPAQKIQFLCDRCDEKLTAELKENRFDLDIVYPALTEKMVRTLHGEGIQINCWTCDSLADAKKLCDWGVDYITTNILTSIK